MASPFDGLADVFVGTLGEAVTVTPTGGSAREITALVVRRPFDDVGITQGRPMFHARASDVSDLADGDSVTIGAEDFVVRELRPDGKGMVNVVLEGD